jgi:hypothetical protein
MSEQSNAVPIHQLDPHMRLNNEGEAGLRWHVPTEAPFQLSGFAWFEQDGKYRRMPLAPSAPLPHAVDKLANCTAGGQIRFRTDSAKLSVKVRLSAIANMNHMPATGQCGFDCYIDIQGKTRYHNTTKYDHRLQEYESMLIDLKRRESRTITLYFPLYQGVEEVRVGLEPGAEIEAPPPFAGDKRVIVYGTSITQGGCANRPGMAYTNIMSRRIPLEFINLGFSGNGRGEPEVAQVISEIPRPACLVLDYEANCPSPQKYEQTVPEFIRIYRAKHPGVPILVVSKIRLGREWLDEDLLNDRLIRQEIGRRTVAMLNEQGDRDVHFFDGAQLLGDDYEECTVDGAHPTDLGFLRMADGLTPAVEKLLQVLGG